MILQPIFSDQLWRIRAFDWAESLLDYYRWRGRDRLRRVVAHTILSGAHYFQTDYANDSRLWVCPRHGVGKHVLRMGVYEPYACALIGHLVGSGFSYIDVGASIGTHTVVAAKSRQGSSTVRLVAFEPFPRTYQVLLRNC